MARSLSELRDAWWKSAIRAFGACTIYQLAERARAAAAVWARVWPVVDAALAAVDVTAVVYEIGGGFRRWHLLAEARRHFAHVLRGVDPTNPAWTNRSCRPPWGGYTRPMGRMMTADLRALYPHDIEDQAVIRPLTGARSAARYEKARLAASVSRVLGEVLLDVVVRGGAAQFDDAPQYRPGSGHQGRDHFE
ncbi:hypothetical protein [Streptomyces sp. NPDC050164]|uniref:hypothetical protein n=1 Tax=Streptomyces sp. NPDC050164 TaxID=3365605 RepID=UPI00379F3C1B